MTKQILFPISLFVLSCICFNPLSFANTQENQDFLLAQAQAKSNPYSTDQLSALKDAQQAAEFANPTTSPSLNGEIPDWLKRTNYAAYVGTDQRPIYYLETVQPLYQSADKIDTVFTHTRVSIMDGRGTYSPGLGYRRLVFNNNLMLGVNTFFDYQDLHREYRQGVGLEAITQTAELRVNSYFDLSPVRTISDDGNTTVFEKVVNGGDVEIGTPVPYLPWIKIFGSYYRYAYRYTSDMSGWQERVQFSPFPFTTINFITSEDNAGPREYRMDGRITLRFDTLTLKSLLSMFKFTQTAYPSVDLSTRTLDRVERNFNIQTERWSTSKSSPGVTVEIGRT
ncbi:MAG: inverse autotransporter beta domain-containing protein [Candidatus Omnitrophica bacterium]|nr:inverse autotransporter beta domain-containing protein [Candidatus Omnitrophota bacterium]